MGFKVQWASFTWSNNQLGEAHIKESLDRAVCNSKFLESLHRTLVLHLDPIGSDHCSLLVYFEYNYKRAPQVFKFDRFWVEHPDYWMVVEEGWKAKGILRELSWLEFEKNINNCRRILIEWSKNAFPNCRKIIN